MLDGRCFTFLDGYVLFTKETVWINQVIEVFSFLIVGVFIIIHYAVFVDGSLIVFDLFSFDRYVFLDDQRG